MSTVYNLHARDCGIDMCGREAVPVRAAAHRIAAVPVIHPETREEIIPEGFKVTAKGVAVLIEAGCDYVICER